MANQVKFPLGSEVADDAPEKLAADYRVTFESADGDNVPWRRIDASDSNREALKDLAECEQLVARFLEDNDPEAYDALCLRISSMHFPPGDVKDLDHWKHAARQAIQTGFLDKVPIGLNFAFDDRCLPGAFATEHARLRQEASAVFGKLDDDQGEDHRFVMHTLCQVSMGTTRPVPFNSVTYGYGNEAGEDGARKKVKSHVVTLVATTATAGPSSSTAPQPPPPLEIVSMVPSLHDSEGVGMIASVGKGSRVTFVTKDIADRDAWSVPLSSVDRAYKLNIIQVQSVIKKDLDDACTKVKATIARPSDKTGNRLWYDVEYRFGKQPFTVSLDFKDVIDVRNGERGGKPLTFSKEDVARMLMRVVRVTELGDESEIEDALG